MLFHSYLFIFLFLPCTVIGYYLWNRYQKYTLAAVWLSAMSLWFCGYLNVWYAVILCVGILINYSFGRILTTFQHKRKLLAGIAVSVNLSALFFFKYFDFFIESCNQIIGTDFMTINLLLPLGISFYTFRQIAYIIDVYRHEVREEKGFEGFVYYIAFITYFPLLIQGPIALHKDIMPQLRDTGRKKADFTHICQGIYEFVQGLAKKVLIADSLARIVDYGYLDVSVLNGADSFLIMLSYTLQLYFDFSGYCDMASGVSRMLNIELPVNFRSPYKACSIIEFWKKWHITLTDFLRKYLYFPLGGNRKGTFRTYLNIMIVFLLSGLWHGAAWTFLLWGGLHGAANVIQRAGTKCKVHLPRILGWMLTFGFVNICWIFFRAGSIAQAFTVIGSMFTKPWNSISVGIAFNFAALPEITLLQTLLPAIPCEVYCVLMVTLSLFAVLLMKNVTEKTESFLPQTKNLVFISILFLWCVVSLSGVSAFLYFNF